MMRIKEYPTSTSRSRDIGKVELREKDLRIPSTVYVSGIRRARYCNHSGMAEMG